MTNGQPQLFESYHDTHILHCAIQFACVHSKYRVIIHQTNHKRYFKLHKNGKEKSGSRKRAANDIDIQYIAVSSLQ